MGRAAAPKAFNRLAWSNLAAQLAEQISFAAIPLFAVIAFDAGPGETGWLQTAYTLPFLLLAVPIGIAADRVSRVAMLRGGECVRVASLAGILYLMCTQRLDLLALGALALVSAFGTVVYWIVTPSLVPSFVGRKALAPANARMELARTVAFAVGPPLAGALMEFSGGTRTFALAATLSLAALVLLCTVPEPARNAAATHTRSPSFAQGLRFVFGHELLRPVLFTQVVFNGSFFLVQAVYVPFALSVLGLSTSQIGLSIGAYGLGMVVGALAGPRVLAILRLGIVVAVGPLCGLLASALLTATIWVPSGLLAAFSYFLFGIGPILWVISTTTLRQTVTPAHLLGRVSAVHMLGYAARPVGSALAAVLGGLYGAAVCLIVATVAFLWQLLIMSRSPLVRLSGFPERAEGEGMGRQPPIGR